MNPLDEQRGIVSFFFLSLVGFLFVFILVVANFFYGIQPRAGEAAQSIEFKVKKGESFKAVSARLSQENLIKSISMFKLYSLLTGAAKQIQPGVYTLDPSMSVPYIVQNLTSGKNNDIAVTIPEGATLKDIENILVARDVIKENEIVTYPLQEFARKYPFLGKISSLEGFLFPETYRFTIGSDPRDVIDRFLSTFEKRLWPMLVSVSGWYDRLIIASLLEKEVVDFTERQIIAGIILKRLSADWPLQVDATITYAKCNGEFQTCASPEILRSDIAVQSPYNTYERLGLPPTPIANPGETAVKAALTPQKSSYWYYLTSRKTKETYFSKSLDEHNIKRAKYL